MRVGLHSDVVFSFLCLYICLCMPLYHRQVCSRQAGYFISISTSRHMGATFNFRGNNRSVRTCVDE
ncbi:hypothetical protein P167DRAFT_531872 [Morchella conica CCBAS932]|uniref:Uncharacterized protein n=1 Tax=Morchella conica CCBAS932 TaxID=1392247 RepID=A0A3N4LG47_9PEZI|nr:hypothetical protein P167DRAFT_531872 [Morchella conica CCBAS932]